MKTERDNNSFIYKSLFVPDLQLTNPQLLVQLFGAYSVVIPTQWEPEMSNVWL